ncbi:MAG: PilZ domain-containing protein [Candidatus Moranbacteria bacterium]|jgi:hypothetical protein|nr:PilZ domain-containing protein [Candidatus Moranbacteria bacterium]
MTEVVEVLRVDNRGEICIKCSSCQRHKAVKAPNKHRIAVKCACGETIPFEIERRVNPRTAISTEAILGKKVTVKVTDLSLGGLAFESLMAIPVGIKVNISFVLKISEKREVEADLDLVIVRRSGFRYGAKFLDLPDYSEIKKGIYWMTR